MAPTITAKAKARVWPSDCAKLLRPFAAMMMKKQYPDVTGEKHQDLVNKVVARARPQFTNGCLKFTRKTLNCIRNAPNADVAMKCEADANGAPAQGDHKAEKLAVRACACADVQCARKVFADFSVFMIKNKDKMVSKVVAERAGAAAKKMTNCLLQKGMTRAEITAGMKKIQAAP